MSQGNENRKQLRSSKTRCKIETIYLSLMQEKHWERISVTEICELAGISRGTFYQHFEDIYDVMEQIQSGILAEMSSRLENVKAMPAVDAKGLAEDFEKNFSLDIPPMFIAWYDFCEEHKEQFKALCHVQNGDLYFPKRVMALIRPHLDEMMDRDGLPRDSYREHFHTYYFNMMYHMMYSWLCGENGDGMTGEMMADVLNATRVGASYRFFKLRYKASEKHDN